MSSESLSTTLVEFTATVQDHKNRLVAIPAEARRQLGLESRRNNHVVRVSIRRAGKGRWNHHYFKLTGDNEFAIPTDVTGVGRGDRIDVKVHRVIPDLEAEPAERAASSAAGVLLDLMKNTPVAWRTDGADRHDDYLNSEMVD